MKPCPICGCSDPVCPPLAEEWAPQPAACPRRPLRTRLRVWLTAALAGLALSGCVTTGGGRGGAFCDVERPTRLSREVIARMSHDELSAAVAHNRQGARDCGWKP